MVVRKAAANLRCGRAPRARVGLGRLLLLLAVCSGCANFKAVNQPLAQVDPSRGYRLDDTSLFHDVKRIWLFVAFSGGGSRAAAC